MTNKFLKASVGTDGVNRSSTRRAFKNLRGMTQGLFWKGIKNAVGAEKYQLRSD